MDVSHQHCRFTTENYDIHNNNRRQWEANVNRPRKRSWTTESSKYVKPFLRQAKLMSREPAVGNIYAAIECNSCARTPFTREGRPEEEGGGEWAQEQRDVKAGCGSIDVGCFAAVAFTARPMPAHDGRPRRNPAGGPERPPPPPAAMS